MSLAFYLSISILFILPLAPLLIFTPVRRTLK